VLIAAFPGSGEADLVERLAADGDLVFGFVAIDEGEVAGYAAFSRMVVLADETARAARWRSGPDCGGAGSAGPRHRRAADRVRAWPRLTGAGIAIVFVLGEPKLYGRFGFRAQPPRPFASPYAGTHLMAQWLSSPRAPASGRARTMRQPLQT
jgi:putative acetyltransferase